MPCGPSSASTWPPSTHPDLILLDLHLPDIGADARPALIERLREEGVLGFLTKPLEVRELLHLIDGVAAEPPAGPSVLGP